jgi:hypothetical protein
MHASTLLSENFDELSQNLTVTSVGAFTAINGTNIDVVGPTNFAGLCAAPESGNCVDMDGTGDNPQGQLQSNMLFGAGTYLLSFDLVGSGRGSTEGTTVSFGNYTQDFSLASGDDTDGIVVNQLITVTTPGYLDFTADQGGQVGDLLDNVTVTTATAAPTPEPSSIALLGTAMLAGMGVMARRRGFVFGNN